MESNWLFILICCILLVVILFLLKFICCRRMYANIRMQENNLLLKYQDLFNNMPIPYIRCRIFDNNGTNDTEVLDVNKAFNDKLVPKKDIQYKNRAEIEKTKIGSLEKYIGVTKEVLETKKAYIGDYSIDKHTYTTIVTPAEETDVIDIFFIDTTEEKNIRKTWRSTTISC